RRAGRRALALRAAGGAGAWVAADWGIGQLEQRTEAAVAGALAEGGFGWARASADGLMLRLTGEAPDELTHFRALNAAAAVVGPDRIADAIVVPPPPEAVPPSFRLEILRNDEGSSVIGLAPVTLDRAALVARLARLGGTAAGQPTDLIETADYPAPAAWDAAVAVALRAAELAPRARISAAPGRVEVTALADGAADKARLEQALRDITPPGITLAATVSAPRPVISPFALRLSRAPGEPARIETCAADSAAARERILAAAAAAGAPVGDEVCPVGLGAPTPQWGDAAVAAITALAALPAGSVAITDTSVTLDAPAEVPPPAFDAAAEALTRALPRVFTLTATQAPPDTPAPAGPVSFVASAVGDGIRLRGAVSDERMRAAVESFARARFGTVDSVLSVDPAAPSGWTPRVLATLEAMAGLRRGSATVTPEGLRIAGASGDKAVGAALAAQLGRRLGAGVPYELALTYDPRLDPALELPTGETCVARLNDVMAQSEIGFETARAAIAGDPAPTLAKLAEVMGDCGDFRIELGAHTDSQGSDAFNMELSQDRADTVRTAMTAAGIDTALMAARGYGETRPVADNATDAGREANRRIEFRLLSPFPVAGEAAAAEVTRGVTEAQPPEVVGGEGQGATGGGTASEASAARTAGETSAPAMPPAVASSQTQGAGAGVAAPAPAADGGEAGAVVDTAAQDSDAASLGSTAPDGSVIRGPDAAPADAGTTDAAQTDGNVATPGEGIEPNPAPPVADENDASGTDTEGTDAMETVGIDASETGASETAAPGTGEPGPDASATRSTDVDSAGSEADASGPSAAVTDAIAPDAAPAAPDATAAVTTDAAPAAPGSAPPGEAAPDAAPALPLTGRLTGPPPALSGGDLTLPPLPALTSDAETADELLAEEGIALRPDSITVQGSRISTPVPPPLPQGAPTAPPPPDGSARPTPRPER
ncbi:OmpA family protein, partial [Paracoccus sanguinis]|uniref:OmpA family protein n=1 Tax=Paracoccus sanguinis TaxID=1545044 RepID=UPI0006922F32